MMEVELLSSTQDAENLMITIARESSERKNKTEDIGKLIKYLIINKHWSPFEHAHMSIRITTSRAIAAQLLRHRSFSFQELSQRYAVVGDQEPLELRVQALENRQSSIRVIGPDTYAAQRAKRALQHAQDTYNELLDFGVARESARLVLPLNTQTRLIMTGSIRSWIHFFQTRCTEHTQKEARLIAKKIRDECFKGVCVKTYDALFALASSRKQDTQDTQESLIGRTIVVTNVETRDSCYNIGDTGVIVSLVSDSNSYVVNFENQGNPRVRYGGPWRVPRSQSVLIDKEQF